MRLLVENMQKAFMLQVIFLQQNYSMFFQLLYRANACRYGFSSISLPSVTEQITESILRHQLRNPWNVTAWSTVCSFKYGDHVLNTLNPLKVVLLWLRHLKLYLRLLGSFFSPFGHSCFTSKVNIKGKKSWNRKKHKALRSG